MEQVTIVHASQFVQLEHYIIFDCFILGYCLIIKIKISNIYQNRTCFATKDVIKQIDTITEVLPQVELT